MSLDMQTQKLLPNSCVEILCCVSCVTQREDLHIFAVIIALWLEPAIRDIFERLSRLADHTIADCTLRFQTFLDTPTFELLPSRPAIL